MRLLAIIALCLFISCDGHPVQIPESERVYDYRGQTYISSTLGSKQASKWNLYAKIVIQTYKDHAVIKLEDVETTMFNGYLEEEFNALKKKIPEEANVLGEPFIMLYNTSIKTGENEPNWSLNIKRAIAGILYVDIRTINEPKTHTVEETMYGRCNVTYTTSEEGTSIKLMKTISTDECGGEIQDYYTVNRQYECPEYEHDQFPREIVRTYYINDKSNPHKISKIQAESSIIFQVTPSDVQTFHLKQIQSLYLDKYEDIKQKIDSSKATSIHDIKFKHGKYPMDGRTTNSELTTEELVANLLEKLESLRTESKEETTFNNWNISDGLDNGFDAFVKQTLETLEEVYDKIKDDEELVGIFSSYLPYVGSPDTVRMIIKLVRNSTIDKAIKLRMLALFPKYINENNEEVLKLLEKSFQKVGTHDIVYNSAILALGQMIGYMKKEDTISKELYDHYVNDCQNRLRETKVGDEQIVYIMALKNMDPPLQIFLGIIEDDTLPQDIRSIAINSCLPKMKHKSKTMRDKLLPILKNETLYLDIRVAALNGLIESRMPISKFEHIFEYLKEEKGNMDHRHLYHYLFSSLASYRYDTKCKTGLFDLAETYLPKMKEPTGENTWMTGNFRTGFTNKGNDFGSIHQLRTVSNPKTNTIEIIEFTMDHSMMGLRRQYKVYLKSYGILNKILKSKLTDKKFKSVKAFTDILKANNFKLPESSLDLELLVIVDNMALLATKFTKKDFNKVTLVEFFIDLTKWFVKDGFLIKYPIMDYLHIPSDLGTDLTLGLDQEELDFITAENFDKLLQLQSGDFTLKYRTYLATSKSFHVYNPIDNVKQGGHNINIRNTYFEIKFDIKSENQVLRGVEVNSDDIKFLYNSEMLTQLFAMDETAIKKYCPKCEIEQTVYDDKQQLVEDKSIPLGFYHMIIKSNYTKFKDLLLETVNEQVGNYEVFPLKSLYHMVEGYYLWDHYLPKWATNSLTWKLEPNGGPLNISAKFIGSYEDLKNDNEVLPGSLTTLSTNIVVKKIKDDETLHDIVATTTFREEPGLYNQSLEQTVEISRGKNYLKACIVGDILIPKINPDYYSISPANPLLVNFDLQFGIHDKKGEKCSNRHGISIRFETECTVLDEQKELMTKADEYPFKQCKEDSKNLKYTAPTETCNMASNEMNKYRKFDIDVKGTSYPELAEFHPFSSSSFLSINNFHEKVTVEFGVKRKSIKLTHNKGNDSMVKFEAWAAKHVYPFVTEDWLPTSKDLLPAVDDDFVTLGSTSTCVITNKNVQTFYGNLVDNHKEKRENIALIECKKAREGVRYEFDKNGQLELEVWMEQDVIIAKPKGKEVQVIVNDTELEKDKWISSDKLKVFHLADDAIIIRGPLMEIYYNIEYIHINMISIYNNNICGICSS